MVADLSINSSVYVMSIDNSAVFSTKAVLRPTIDYPADYPKNTERNVPQTIFVAFLIKNQNDLTSVDECFLQTQITALINKVHYFALLLKSSMSLNIFL